MLYQLGDIKVRDLGAGYIAHNATIVGNVELGKDSSIWFNVVIRADSDPIIIGAETNIQDGSVLHTDPGQPLQLGRGVTVGHKAMLHGCTVGDYSLIGIGAVVLNGAQIGSHCLIGAGALVTEKMVIPDGSLVVGAPAQIKRVLSAEQQQGLEKSAAHYVSNGHRFASTMTLQQK